MAQLTYSDDCLMLGAAIEGRPGQRKAFMAQACKQWLLDVGRVQIPTHPVEGDLDTKLGHCAETYPLLLMPW